MDLFYLPMTAAIIMVGLSDLLSKYIKYKKPLPQVELSGEVAKMLKEFDDYKKRVDKLTLKAGFNL